jgi:hypothetical protein
MLGRTHQIGLKGAWSPLAGAVCAAAAVSMALASDISDANLTPVHRSERSSEKYGCSQQTWPYIDVVCTDRSVTQLRRVRVIPIDANTPSYVLATVPTSAPASIERSNHSEPSASQDGPDAAGPLTLRPISGQSGSGRTMKMADDTAVGRVVSGGKVRTHKVR